MIVGLLVRSRRIAPKCSGRRRGAENNNPAAQSLSRPPRDMGAAGAASPLHEPVLGFVRRRKRDLGCGYANRRAKSRERERILGAFERLGLVAENPRLASDRGDRFRLMFEAGAIDQPNRIIGADQHFDRDAPLCRASVHRTVRLRALSRQGSSLACRRRQKHQSTAEQIRRVWRRTPARAPNSPRR